MVCYSGVDDGDDGDTVEYEYIDYEGEEEQECEGDNCLMDEYEDEGYEDGEDEEDAEEEEDDCTDCAVNTGCSYPQNPPPTPTPVSSAPVSQDDSFNTRKEIIADLLPFLLLLLRSHK